MVGGPEMKAFQAPTFFYYNFSELSDSYSIHLLSLQYYSISFIGFFFSPDSPFFSLGRLSITVQNGLCFCTYFLAHSALDRPFYPSIL